MPNSEYSNVVRLRPPGHPRPPGMELGPRPYYQPVQDHCGQWWWYPEGSPYNRRPWKGPGKPPATFLREPGPLRMPVKQAWTWPVEGYISVTP